MDDVAQPVKVIDGKKLRRQRILAGLTQAALADKAGCSDVHVWYLENHKRDASVAMLHDLADALPCHPADLMADEPELGVA